MVDMSLYDSPGKHSLNYCLSLHILNFDLQGLGPNSLWDIHWNQTKFA